jgi:sugar transferase EpsL
LKKRIFDFIASFFGLILISPVFLILAFLVRHKHGSPVFFTQIRPGKGGQAFRMIKFRSMTNDKDINGKLLPNDQRLTNFGKLLRSTSLDELPELINVIKGDMSLVGPRPLLMEYLPYFTETQMKRHSVRPGITGWSQVNGRNAIDWDKKVALDVWYVDNQSFMLDLKILIMTVVKVFKRQDINYEGEKFMPRFDEYMKRKVVSDQQIDSSK